MPVYSTWLRMENRNNKTSHLYQLYIVRAGKSTAAREQGEWAVLRVETGSIALRTLRRSQQRIKLESHCKSRVDSGQAYMILVSVGPSTTLL